VGQRGTIIAGDCNFVYGKGNENHQLGTLFVLHRIVSALERVEFVRVRASYIVLNVRCFNIIVLNVQAQSEEKCCAVMRLNPRHMDQVRDFDFMLNLISFPPIPQIDSLPITLVASSELSNSKYLGSSNSCSSNWTTKIRALYMF